MNNISDDEDEEYDRVVTVTLYLREEKWNDEKPWLSIEEIDQHISTLIHDNLSSRFEFENIKTTISKSN